MISAKPWMAHSKAAMNRKRRPRTTHIILHRTVGPRAQDAVNFFTQDPEGIATVAVSGSYVSKTPLIANWRKEGVPAVYQGKGFVPYHLLVDDDGAYQMLDLDAIGAHAGAFNDRSIAIACPGDWRAVEPPHLTVLSVVTLCEQLRSLYPTITEIIDHDEVNRRINAPEKGCIGRCFPVDFVRKEVVKDTGRL